jgi:hypothetical protein
MWNWWRRQRERDRELEAGVDAHLVRANRRRFRACLALMAGAFLLAWIRGALRLNGWLGDALLWTAMIGLVAGLIGLRWAGEESKFLRRPDPEKPPSLFKL